jgi:hypothetical protein
VDTAPVIRGNDVTDEEARRAEVHWNRLPGKHADGKQDRADQDDIGPQEED